MIVWSEEKGHRRQRLAKQVTAAEESRTKKWVKTAPTITDKVQITKAFTTLNEGTSPVNPHESAPFSRIRALRPLRAHEDSIYML